MISCRVEDSHPLYWEINTGHVLGLPVVFEDFEEYICRLKLTYIFFGRK